MPSYRSNLTDTVLPVSAAQKGIYLGQALSLSPSLYNAAECLEICGKFRREYVVKALRYVIDRADVLHVCFKSIFPGEDLQYSQVEQSILEPNWQLMELDFSEHVTPWDEAQRWISSDLDTAVDLQSGPLFQQALIVLSPTRCIWYQRIHHVICDGYGFALIAKKVSELYELLLAGGELPAEVFGDYQNVIRADVAYQDSATLLADKEFWMAALANIQSPVTLKPPASATVQPIHNRSVIPSKQFDAIKVFADNQQCSWADALYALCATWLAYKTAAPVVTLGVPVMVRVGAPAARVPAMVMNINPLPVKISHCENFNDVLIQVSRFQKAARRHQRYRYEALRRDIGAVGGNRRLFGPVVNVMPFERLLTLGEAITTLQAVSAGPVEDISIAFVSNGAGSLSINIEANPNCYSTDDLQQYCDELISLMQACIKNPLEPLSVDANKLSILHARPLNTPFTSVVETIRAQARAAPNAIAIEEGEASFSYKNLMHAVDSMALQINLHWEYLLGGSAGPDGEDNEGGIVALYCTRNADAIIASLAVLQAGFTYVFLDPKGPLSRNKKILADVKPGIVIESEPLFEADSLLRVSLATLKNKLVLSRPVPANNPGEKTCRPQDVAYLTYTSGSTGSPKGVKIGHGALASFVASATQEYALDASDRVLQFAPLHFDASVEEIYLSLCIGATLVLRNESMLGSIPAFLNTLQQWGITVLDLPTAFWHELVLYCANTQIPLPSEIHKVIIGGEAALPERVEQWHGLVAGRIDLLNTYGPSEATVVATCAKLMPNKEVTIGKPLAGRSVAVVDAHSQLVPRGASGQLLVWGQGLGLGYYNLQKETEEKFSPLDSLRWGTFYNKKPQVYYTGDRVKMDAYGNIHFLGRIDDEIKISGHRIHPFEVEVALIAVNGVDEASVVIHKNVLYAFITARGKNSAEPDHTVKNMLSGAEIRQRLSQHLPAPMVPALVEYIDELPINTNGKVDKKVLLKRLELLQLKATRKISSKQSSTEAQIRAVWQEVLGVVDIRSEDDFFLLGGQSLQTIQVASRLSVIFEQEIKVTTLFESPALGDLAAAISGLHPLQPINSRQQVEADSKLALNKYPVVSDSVAKFYSTPKKISAVLLTGATGFVGAQLLSRLLEQDIKVHCLVRADNIQHGFTRVSEALKKQHLPKPSGNQNLIIHVGDASRSLLGFSTNQYHELTQAVDAVIHNAANTSVMRDYKTLRPANVQSTLNVFELSVAARAPIHFVSTIAVAPQEGLPEGYVEWHNDLKDGYQQSKWAAENILAAAHSRGYPVSVYRLGRVTGSTVTGFVNPQDLAWRIISASANLGAYPNIPLEEPWVPVDDLSHIICSHVLQNRTHGVYNPVPKYNVSLKEVFEYLTDYGLKLSAIDFEDWLGQLHGSTDDACQALAGFFIQRKNSGGAVYLPKVETRQTEELMALYKTKFKPFNRTVLYRYFDYAIEHKILNITSTASGSNPDSKCTNTAEVEVKV